MRIHVLASLLAVAAPLCCGSASAQSLDQSLVLPGDTLVFSDATPTMPKKPISFDINALDKTADPCTDFYQYACGNWRKANPIPSDQVRWGRFNELGEYNNYSLYKELEVASTSPKTPLQKKYGDYFAACMDTDAIDKLGAKPLAPELTAIDSLKSGKDLASLNLELSKRYGGGELLGFGVGQDQKDSTKQILNTGQGGLTLPDRDYYLNANERYVKIRSQYVDHMKKMFVLLGDSPEKAAIEADDVLRIETALAKGSMDRVEMRDPDKRYHVMTIAELQKLSPDYNWKQFLTGMNFGSVQTINVSSPGFVTTVNTVLETEKLDALKSYLRWHALHGAAPALAKSFADENFAFFSNTLNGQKEEQPRWKRCTAGTDRALGQAVGQDWVAQNFPPAAKGNTQKLVDALTVALAQDIQQLDWMSDATKVEAKKKLDAIVDKIGYPSKWRDYSAFTVTRDDYLGNLERNSVFERNRNFAKYGKPVDKTEFNMTPPTVNASYNPPMNEINFPAGILQPPFYDDSKDPAVNFGGIGVVIGHEMTHGFDDEGSKYDPTGNVRVWFTPDDLAKFKDRTECTAKEYDGFEVAPGQNLNGHQTLGENTADNGGIRIAFRALQNTLAAEGPQAAEQKIDGYTPAQRFFISFGQVWCENITEQAARVRAKTDPHSAGKWRTDGTVQNFDEFGKAFGCKVGQPMMPASGGCRTW